MSDVISAPEGPPDTAIAACPDHAHRHRIALIALCAAAVGAIAGEIAILNHASVHAFRGNSDGATVVLEGQWMSAGHLALSGWDLSLDSFWTLDALFYTAAVRLFGVHGQLLTLVPSVIGVVVLAVVIAIGVRDRRSVAGQVAVVSVIAAVLAFPANNLAYVFLQGPWHIGTVLACLAAFWTVARHGLSWWIGLGSLALAAGLLGDTQTAALGLAPILAAACSSAVRRRSPRAAIPGVATVALSIALALVIRQIARAFGTFAIATGYPRARAHQIPDNIAHVFSWGISLFGHGALPNIAMDNAAGHIDLIRIVVIALVGAGVAGGIGATVVGCMRGRPASPDDAYGWRLDDLLVFGVLADCALFVFITPNDNGNYARYLTAGVIFATALTARVAGRVVDAVGRAWATGGAAALVVVAGISAIALPRDLGVPPAKQPDIALASFLEAHHLRYGLGDYWSASLTSVESAGRVEVRPVIPNHQHLLVRYGRQSSAAWYRGVDFTFLVYDLARPWRNVNATTATATFGAPTTKLAEGTYRILVWDHPIHVGTAGFSNK